LAVSATNSCRYCINSHTAAVQKLGLDDEALGEVLAVVGLYNQMNRLVDAYQVEPDILPEAAKEARPAGGGPSGGAPGSGPVLSSHHPSTSASAVRSCSSRGRSRERRTGSGKRFTGSEPRHRRCTLPTRAGNTRRASSFTKPRSIGRRTTSAGPLRT